jgi:outer membrane protein OmpA-like peptidoglycan-associated protein
LIAHGIAGTRLAVVGHGESQPVASNDVAAGRAQNRRVELNVID